MEVTQSDIEHLRARFAAAADDANRAQGCPAPERIWASVRGEVDAATRRELVDHTSNCPPCAESWRLAREIGGTGRLMEDAPPASATRAGRWIWIAAVAASIAAVGILLRPVLVQDAPPAQFRAGDETGLRSLIPEDVPVPRANLVLRWSTGPADARYTVEVATADLRVIDRARGLDRPEYHVPEEALSDLPEGALLLWRVQASLAGGRRVDSPTFFVRLD